MVMQNSFKEKVLNNLISNALIYKTYFIDYDYIIFSQAFIKHDYYIIFAHEDNYLHLTGVHTNLKAGLFFEKCISGSLEEYDFDFCKPGKTEKEVKGSVRRKMNSLPGIMNIFTEGTKVEEDFEKNRIICGLAATDNSSTLGFMVDGTARPMTLLKGNCLDFNKAKELELVLRRKRGEKIFSTLILGDEILLKKYEPILKDLVDSSLLK